MSEKVIKTHTNNDKVPTKKTGESQKNGKKDRKERLSAQLRENLLRRKHRENPSDHTPNSDKIQN